MPSTNVFDSQGRSASGDMIVEKVLGTSYNKVRVVYDNMSKVILVADNVVNLNYLETNMTVINRIGTSADNLDRVHTSINNLDRVHQSITNIDNFASITPNLDRVFTSIDKIDRVHTSIDNLDTVYSRVGNVDTVATNIAAVTSVSSNITSVNTVVANVTAIQQTAAGIAGIAAIIPYATNIVTVSNNITPLVAVGNNINNINEVRLMEPEIETLATNIASLAGAAAAVTQAVDGVRQLFVAGTDFTKNVSTYLPLQYFPAKSNSVNVFFSGIYQNSNTWTRVGKTLSFNAPIDATQVEVVYTIPSSFVGLSPEDILVIQNAEAAALASQVDAQQSAVASALSASQALAAATQAKDGVKELFIAGVQYTKNVSTTLSLGSSPSRTNSVKVFFDGAYQNSDSYTRIGLVLTFNTAIAANKVEITYDVPSAFVALDAADISVLIAAQTGAELAKTNAQASANSAALSYDNFDDRYLGSKSVAPTLDNDGNSLITGAMYFNSTVGKMYIRNLSAAWQLTTASAEDVNYTPSGTLAATTVQGAINEIVSDLAAPSGATTIGYGTETVEASLTSQKALARARVNTPVTALPPKYMVLDPIAGGDPSQAFPSVARYMGIDYVFYRAGVGHTGNDGVLKLVRVTHETGLASSPSVMLDLAYDSRDPCVLTDHYGNAVLVAGKMRIAMFYTISGVATSVSIYEFDPANVAAGLTNPVTLPNTVVAMRSDFKQLADGSYGFVAYNVLNNCYWVRSTDCITYSLELIGPGNEAAVGQEYDGTLVVIARTALAPYTAVVYKKPITGVWAKTYDLPVILNAPVLRKLSRMVQGGSSVTPSTAGESGGWLLLARDRRNVPSMNDLDTGNARLVALISRDVKGTKIDTFDIYQDVMGLPSGNPLLNPTGDAFYATAVTREFGSSVDVYTYAPVQVDIFQPFGSYNTKIIKLSGIFKPGIGLYIPPAVAMPPNMLLNGDFTSGKHWRIGQNSVLSSGKLITTGTVSNPSNSQVVILPVGRQYRIIMRVRRVAGDGTTEHRRHLKMVVLNSTAAIVTTLYSQDTAAMMGTDFHIIRGQPFVADGGIYTIQVLAESNTGADVSELDWAYLGEAQDLTEFVDATEAIRPVVASGSVSGTTGGTPILTCTYSSNFWPLFGHTRDAVTGRPYAFETPSQAAESLRVVSLTDGEPKPMLLRSITVNADYSVTFTAEPFPSQSAVAVSNPLNFVIESKLKTVG